MSVLSPEFEVGNAANDDDCGVEVVQKSTAAAGDGPKSENGRHVGENGAEDASVVGECTPGSGVALTEYVTGEVSTETPDAMDTKVVLVREKKLSQPNEAVKGKTAVEGKGTGPVEALLIFGGMDTCGHMHNDCFIIVPPQPLH